MTIGRFFLSGLALISLSAVAQVPVAPPASAFASLPEMSFVRLSPDGQRVAWANDPGGMPVVVVFDLGTGKDLKRLRPSNSRVRDLDWADNKTLIISVSRSLTAGANTVAEKRYEFFRYLALDVESKNSEAKSLLMEHPDRENVTAAYLERLHPEKPGTVVMSTYRYSETSRRAEIGSRIAGGRKDAGWELALFEVDIGSGKGRMLESGTPYTDEWVLDAAGRAVARSEWNPESRRYSILVKEGESWRTVYSAEIDYELHLQGLSADGKSLLARSPRGSDKFKIWTIPTTGGEPGLLYEHPEYDVTSIAFDRFSSAPVGYRIGGPEPTIVWTDPKLEGIQKAVSRAFPGKVAQLFDRSADYKRIVARVEGASSPPVYYLIDLVKGAADIIGEAYPVLADATLGTLEAMKYKAPDGHDIPAYLTMPPGREPKNLPLVVFPHGGPYARDDIGFDWWAQFLATRGYVVLQPQFRGSWGFGADLFRAGHKQWGRGMQDDISAGIRFLVERGVADPKRVCIVGASFGGYAALAGAAFTPELYACAVSVNGISDIPQMFGFIREKSGADSDAIRAWRDLIGDPSEKDVIAFSPARSIDSIRVPILLIHGLSDTVVPPTQSENFARLLKVHGKDYTYIPIEGEDHWLSTSQSRATLLQAIDDFLTENLR